MGIDERLWREAVERGYGERLWREVMERRCGLATELKGTKGCIAFKVKFGKTHT